MLWIERVDPRGRPYYWIGGEAPTGVNEEGTDVGALAAGYVSITPLQLDLTNYKAMDVLKSWDWREANDMKRKYRSLLATIPCLRLPSDSPYHTKTYSEGWWR